MSTRAFLIGRTKETIHVPVSGMGGSKNIEIRARLSKSETKLHQAVFDNYRTAFETDRGFVENEEDEVAVAKFLELITIDEDLTEKFWLRDDIPPELADELLIAYFVTEPTRRMVEIQKFLLQRLRAGI